MTAHLTPDELMSLVENGPVAPAAERHLAECAECRREAEGLRALVGDLRQAEVPEPSPLFWEHFSARVAEAVREAPGPLATGGGATPWWQRWAGLGWTLGAASVVAALLLVSFGPFAPGGPVTPPVPEATTAASAAPVPETVAPDGEDWSLIAAAVEDLDYDDVRAIGASLPDAAELAVLDLDVDEQHELARLLREEIARLSPAALDTL